MSEAISIQFLKGVGPAKAKILERLGVQTVEDLLYLFPRRYEDRRRMTRIRDLQIGEYQTVAGTVQVRGSRRSFAMRKALTQIVLKDDTGRIFCTWFNQPYLEKYFRPGQTVILYGKVEIYKDRIQMVSPEYEVIEEEGDQHLNLKRIVPVYPLTPGIGQRYLRRLVRVALDNHLKDLTDELPVDLRNRYRLANIRRSLEAVHFPDDFQAQEEAMKRLAFEEFYFFQISLYLRRQSIKQKQGHAHPLKDGEALRFLDRFGFELTNAQKRVIQEIRVDMAQPTPMLRLLQGDVGCGKTVVAVFGCLAGARAGRQSALMAPTEILARQHFENIKGWTLKGGPLEGLRPKLLLGGMPQKEKSAAMTAIAGGRVDIVVGTHALITDEVSFRNLGYVVIDEQHKFGVRQRALLSDKGSNPDVLIMTATPIPRTLCLTLYGDLDVSVIDEQPTGRGRVSTRLFSHAQADEVYRRVRAAIAGGRQAYIIYPIIEESERLELKAATAMYTTLAQDALKGVNLGLVHGQMKREDIALVMEKFSRNEIHALVSTTVLEVGVDIPNATVMVIEHADRFGLSQLHQLRGRIGRDAEDASCYLISDPGTPEGSARLRALTSTRDGFKIAQKDLEIRGPGHYFGRHQHGLQELKVADPLKQIVLLEQARKEAGVVIRTDPDLKRAEHQHLRAVVKRRYPTYLSMIAAG